jgi:predicted LPLAT superfamily acyltransferase
LLRGLASLGRTGVSRKVPVTSIVDVQVNANFTRVLMEAPVYFVFALRRKDPGIKPEYDIRVHKCPLSFDCSRKERLHRSTLLAVSFATLLESYCKQNPFQWYNFHDFWSKEV